MSLSAGSRLGPYEITGLLGAGGMGEVYRARDARLNRDVAIKVLPDLFASDPDRLARFQREAQVLASLNHPNIGGIYGLEETDPSAGSGQAAVRALVLEFVDGPTLAERLAQGSGLRAQGRAQRDGDPGPKPVALSPEPGPSGLPLDEVLSIARQIAEALEAAHEHGIMHRDLKPANIILQSSWGPTPTSSRSESRGLAPLAGRGRSADDVVVKVLDFGLAKAIEGEQGAADVSQSPTLSVAATRAGMILGTAAYMSPEQARGKTVDKRTDIWAFGCVLYEMLTGKRAFGGDDVTDTLAFIITKEPDWSALPPATPLAIRRLLRRSLEKDCKRRLPDIADARIEIDEALTTPPSEPGQITRVVLPSAWRRVAAHVSTALVASAVVGAVVWLASRPVLPPLRVSRFTITPPSAAGLTISGIDRDLAITPDGSRVVYTGANSSALFVRALDQLDATRLTGLGTPRGPFLSPDSQWIGFADGTTALKKVAVSGGPAVMLGRLDSTPRGATWGPDDTIVFATSSGATGLQQIPSAGGAPTVLTRPNRAGGEADHLWPEFLPEGEAVLFTITATTGGLDAASIAVLDLRTGAQTILIRGGSHAHYVRSGHLVYGAAGTLRAVPFDLANRTVIGPPVPVVPEVVTTLQGAADAVVAGDGTLVYVPGSVAATERTLVWVDRQRREEPITAPPRAYVFPRLAPDGTRLALSILDEETDIWLWDLARAILTRVTFDPGGDTYPVWTPDSRRLLFSSERAGVRNLFGQAADGTGAIERLTESPHLQNATAVSPDGTRLVFTELAPGTNEDVMTLSLDGTRPSTRSDNSGSTVSTVERSTRSGRGEPVEPRRAALLIQTPFAERNGEVSPDGRWLAYEANDSGRAEIYVRPFPDVTSGRWQVSTGGGTRPLWARSGQELFYLAPTGALMRVGVEAGRTWTATAPAQLLEGRYFAGAANLGRTYDVSPDGRRFLMIKPGGGTDSTAAPTSLVVVQNWFEELKRLVPTR